MTHYELLSVSPSASTAEIRKAYVQITQHLAEERATASGEGFAAIQNAVAQADVAWATLSDTARRRAYDASLGPPVGAADDQPAVPSASAMFTNLVSGPEWLREQADATLGLPTRRLLLGVALIVALVVISAVALILSRHGLL